MTIDRIEINPPVLQGKPVIRGTRIPVESLLRKLSEGATETDLLDAHPRLTHDDIQAALRYAADAVGHEVIVLPRTVWPARLDETAFFASSTPVTGVVDGRSHAVAQSDEAMPVRSTMLCRMPSDGRPLDVAAIRAALDALARELSGARERGELLVVGGAAMALLYNARPTTKDVDVYIVKPEEAGIVRRAAARVAEALDLPGDWLNDAAKGFIHGLALGETVFESDSLTVRALAPEQLLAMKLCAWRDSVDFDDARLLLSKLTGNRTTVWARVEPFLVPGRETTACYAFEDLWENRRGPDAAD